MWQPYRWWYVRPMVWNVYRVDHVTKIALFCVDALLGNIQDGLTLFVYRWKSIARPQAILETPFYMFTVIFL